MAMKTNKGKEALFTEINITPLTDIFLVLLIINIPEINSGISVEQKNCTVSVTKEGLMYINGKETSPTALASELSTLLPTLEKKEVVVKADTEAKNSIVLKIMSSDEVDMQTSAPADMGRTKVQRSSIPTDDEEWVE